VFLSFFSLSKYTFGEISASLARGQDPHSDEHCQRPGLFHKEKYWEKNGRRRLGEAILLRDRRDGPGQNHFHTQLQKNSLN